MKKNRKWLFNTLVILLAGLLAFAGCDDKDDNGKDNGDDPPKPPTGTVTGIAISPNVKTLENGASFTFSATVAGTGDFTQGVTWEVGSSSVQSGTKFEGATLFIDDNETIGSFPIRARSTYDTTKTGTANIIRVNAGLGPVVSSITVNPGATQVEVGKTQNFSVTLVTANNPNTTIVWSISTAGVAAGTSIGANGLLTVAAAETLTEIKIRATSVETPTTFGEATVTVVPPGQGPSVDEVIITAANNATSVARGGSLQLSAEVKGTNNPSQDVTWRIMETTRKATTITPTQTGILLYVATFEFEATTKLTIRATSAQDTSEYDEIELELTGDYYHPNVRSGNSAMRFAPRVPNDSHWMVGHWFVELELGEYVLTYWFKGMRGITATEGNTHRSFMYNETRIDDLGFFDGNREFPSTPADRRYESETWTQVTIEFEVTVVSDEYRFAIQDYGSGGGGELFFDDFSLIKVGGDGFNFFGDPGFESGAFLYTGSNEEAHKATAGKGWFNYGLNNAVSIFTIVE